MHRLIAVLILAALAGCAAFHIQTPAEANALFWAELRADRQPLVILAPVPSQSAAERRHPAYARRGHIVYAEDSTRQYAIRPDESEWIMDCVDRGGRILWQWQDGDFHYVDCWPGLGDL